MTGTREPPQNGSIEAMLRDAGLDSAAELRSSLQELSALVPDRAPAPRADLAKLLAAGAESLPAGVTGLAERRGRKRRLAIVGGAVVGAMTLGAGAVAASSEDFRANVSHTVGSVFQPSGGTPGVAPRPALPSPADLPAPSASADAANAATPPAADTPAAPGPAAAVPSNPGAAAAPPAAGRGGVLPAPPRRPVTPGIPALPGPGGDRNLPKSPVAAPTLPAVAPTVPGVAPTLPSQR